jgi:hypothetical protein
MVIGTTDEHHLVTSPAEISYIKIGGNISPQMTDVTWAIRIWQSARHQYRLVTHHYTFDDDAINKMIIMRKKLSFRTVSLGTEPTIPEEDVLARWIRENRGRNADLITFLLEEGLIPQIVAEIGDICTGGRFYGNRWLECLTGIEERRVVGELGYLSVPVMNDALDVGTLARGARVALPAPHLLALKDSYFGDELEMQDALSVQYRNLMRTMRDSGIAGHVLHCDRIIEHEVEMLAGKKVFFYPEKPDSAGLATLLEYQQTLAVTPEDIPLVEGLIEEYEINRIILLDPGPEELSALLTIRDPDQIATGGYCTSGCNIYWKRLVDASTIVRQ